MAELNTFFHQAAEDLLFLLDRRYPKSPAVDLVGNRYRLGKRERMVLYRGLFDRETASNRKKKRVGFDAVLSSPLLVDGFNVTITLDSYLRGLFVFRATDGYVRDVSEFHGGYQPAASTGRSLDLIAGVLGKREGKTVVVLDSCMDACRTLVRMTERAMERLAPSVVVRTEKKPYDAIASRSLQPAGAAVATSDTGTLDRAEKAVDLPSFILEKRLEKRVFDLERLLCGTTGRER